MSPTATPTPGTGGGPVLVGYVPSLGLARGLQIDAATNRAYVASAEFGLSVMDVSNRSVPVFLGAANLPFNGTSIAVAPSANRALVTGTTPGGLAALWVVDVSIPTQPLIVGYLEADVPPSVGGPVFNGVAIDRSGTVAVVTVGNTGVWTIDLTNPSRPDHAASLATEGAAAGVTIVGTRGGGPVLAYVANGLKGLAILDVSTPSMPTVRSNKPLATGVGAQDVAVVGTRAFVGSSVYLYIVDVSDPAAPTTLSARLLSGGTTHISATATRAAVIVNDSPNSRDVLELWDVSTSTNPIRLSVTALGNAGSGQGVAITDTGTFVTVGGEGLKVLNASGSVQGSATDTFRGDHLAVAADIAVVAGSDTVTNLATLRVADIGLPNAPTVVGMLESTVPPNVGGPVFKSVGLDASGSVALVTAGTAGVWRVDVSNPATPIHSDSWVTAGAAAGITVSGNLNTGPVLAYVANGSKGLAILNVPTVGAPTLLGSKSIAAGVTAQDVAVVGTRAFLGTSLYLYVMDVTNPAAPTTFAGRLLTSGAAHIAATETRAAVIVNDSANGQDILELWNVTNSSSPVRLSITPVGSVGSARGIVLTASKAYIGTLTSGVSIFDISSSTPTQIGTATTVGDAYDVCLNGSYLYASDMPATLDVFELIAP
jgi:hypothetical protein